MEYKIIIPHQFHSLNEFIGANRSRHGNWSGGNAMKHEDQKIVRAYLPRIRIGNPVRIEYKFYERNRKRDLDNVSGYFHKIFQDALVEQGILPNDNSNYIIGFSDEFELDRVHPRIEITIKEVQPGG